MFELFQILGLLQCWDLNLTGLWMWGAHRKWPLPCVGSHPGRLWCVTVGGILAPNFLLGMQAALGGITASLCPQTKGFLERLSECGVDSGEELISTGRGLPESKCCTIPWATDGAPCTPFSKHQQSRVGNWVSIPDCFLKHHTCCLLP